MITQFKINLSEVEIFQPHKSLSLPGTERSKKPLQSMWLMK